jgi:hypothetical protein
MKTKKWKEFILLTLCGMIVCMIIGIIPAGMRAILPGNFAFQFTLYGFFGALLYAVLKFATTRDFIFIMILFILFDVMLLGKGLFAKLIIHGFYAVYLAGAIFVYVKLLEQQDNKYFLANIFSLAGISAVAFMLIVLTLCLFPHYKFEFSFLESQTFIGLLIGLGLGIGFWLYHKFLAKGNLLKPLTD